MKRLPHNLTSDVLNIPPPPPSSLLPLSLSSAAAGGPLLHSLLRATNDKKTPHLSRNHIHDIYNER